MGEDEIAFCGEKGRYWVLREIVFPEMGLLPPRPDVYMIYICFF
jgi:hypothetical protein